LVVELSQVVVLLSHQASYYEREKMATQITLTDNQVQALFRAIYIHNESYDPDDLQYLEGTGVIEAIKHLEQISAKLQKAGWE